MTVKEWFRKHQPLQLYIVFIMSILFLIVELAVSHITHSLTLLMNSYQMLSNVLALIGYIVTVKFESRDPQDCTGAKKTLSPTGAELTKERTCANSKLEATEHKLKNTFGWARIDVVSMLICCVFSASLCFSVVLAALQIFVHIDHLHEMHHPISVLCMGVAGFLVNTCCYILIGGYTFHQGSFLYVTKGGEVVLNKVAPTQSVRQGERRLSRTKTISSELRNKRQSFNEMCRDVVGCILVIICSIWVHFADDRSIKFIDPGIAVIHAVSLMILSFPYMKESCFILLQTMPGSINIYSLKVDLVKQFPDIVNVHDFHVWQLTANKVISTVHIIFQNPEVYTRVRDEIKKHFISNGITQVTIQPEFFIQSGQDRDIIIPTNVIKCLMPCQPSCGSCLCCPEIAEEKDDLKEVKHSSKEKPPNTSDPTIPIVQTDFPKEIYGDDSTPDSSEPSREQNNLLKKEEKLTISPQEVIVDNKDASNTEL
ncbi:hypothetical protein HHI36_010944 [Cryptolaemus montrouzieri]